MEALDIHMSFCLWKHTWNTFLLIHILCVSPVNEIKSFPHFVDNQVENLLTTRNYFGAKPRTAIFLSRGTLNTYMHYLRAMGYKWDPQGILRDHRDAY